MEHVNLTTRRCFIGPIPEGWLKSHRKSWYKHYLSLSDYSSRSVTFSAKPGISHQRQITGLDGPSASATFGHSFPQPEDIDEEQHEAAKDQEAAEQGAQCGDGDGFTELGAQSTTADTRNEDFNAMPDHEEHPSRALNRRLKLRNKPRSLSFVTAPMRPTEDRKSRLASRSSEQSPPSSSFVTATEAPILQDPLMEAVESGSSRQKNTLGPSHPEAGESPDSPSSPMRQMSRTAGSLNQDNGSESTAHLLTHGEVGTSVATSPEILGNDAGERREGEGQTARKQTTGLVRFNIGKPDRDDTGTTTEVRQEGRHHSWKQLRRRQAHPGEIVKMEKMLVRVDSTVHDLPPEYDENHSLSTESRTVNKWREFVVVCRESPTQDAEFLIQMYKTRVIPAKEQTHVQKRSTHEIPLARKSTRANLYSSLDKTLVIWVPWKRGTLIYILRTKSASSAVEWYTFIRSSLGWQRTSDLNVHVPDLSVTLQLENPFSELEARMDSAQAVAVDEDTVARTMEVEKAAANTIIQRSLKMLEDNPEWNDVLQAWLAKEKMGLAWKRYDRLEWVHGANEQRMYGTMAMQRTHELEIRPKDHYPTNVRIKQETLEEPAPVEGFLIRLTSQKGRVRRLGKMYFKRLYFVTHNQFLCYCRPAKAQPPPPPKISLVGKAKIPSASEIVEMTPLIYAVNPYPTKEGNIEWLQQGSQANKAHHDGDAYKEAERSINTLLEAEGYINLSHIIRVQNAQRGNSVADDDVDQGPGLDFHEEVEDTAQDDGKTDQFDDRRTFELVMKNGLVIRLQAYNETTKKEWVHRLRKLIRYWKLRLENDVTTLKTVRGMNLKRLDCDAEQEAYLGQFAQKWEVTRSVASPKLFNMCGIACCRAITVVMLSPLLQLV